MSKFIWNAYKRVERMERTLSKLSLASFVMFSIAGGGIVLAELCWDSIRGIENSMCIAYLVVLVFYPCIFISFVLALVSIIRIVLYKQTGFILAFLTLILSGSLITWAMILDKSSDNLEMYAPTVTGETLIEQR